MKTSKDPRHRKRIQAVQNLYAHEFNPEQELGDLATAIVKHQPLLDEAIVKAAPARPLEQINKLDLAILRLAAYELLVNREVPYKVIVDEAIEIAKTYGSDSSPQFVNGALGALLQQTNATSNLSLDITNQYKR